MYSLKASTRTCTVSVRAARKVTAPLRSGNAGLRLGLVTVRAEAEKAPEADVTAQAQEALTKATTYISTVWADTADAEKPAAIGIILAAVVAQLAIGATMDVVDRLPVFGDLFELIGLAVTGTFAYSYITDPTKRTSTKAQIDSVISAVTGK